jgi:hypothetical protein
MAKDMDAGYLSQFIATHSSKVLNPLMNPSPGLLPLIKITIAIRNWKYRRNITLKTSRNYPIISLEYKKKPGLKDPAFFNSYCYYLSSNHFP